MSVLTKTLDDDQLVELYAWLSSMKMPLNNVRREYSDGTHMIKLIRALFPSYSKSPRLEKCNAISLKQANWCLINKHILRSLGIARTFKELSDLTLSRHYAAESLLYDLYIVALSLGKTSKPKCNLKHGVSQVCTRLNTTTKKCEPEVNRCDNISVVDKPKRTAKHVSFCDPISTVSIISNDSIEQFRRSSCIPNEVFSEITDFFEDMSTNEQETSFNEQRNNHEYNCEKQFDFNKKQQNSYATTTLISSQTKIKNENISKQILDDTNAMLPYHFHENSSLIPCDFVKAKFLQDYAMNKKPLASLNQQQEVSGKFRHF